MFGFNYVPAQPVLGCQDMKCELNEETAVVKSAVLMKIVAHYSHWTVKC